MTQLISYLIPRIIVSGLRGGSGKTLLSLSLVALWHKKGLKVASFKKGPDYIDAGWLAKAAGGHCFNLDLFLIPQKKILQSFISHTFNAHAAVIEGNRGLYDGVDSKGTYSTAGLAKLLNAPVILVIDCTKATSTVSAMILGCQKLDPAVSIKGVVLNNIAMGRQESVIRKAVKENCRIPVLGAIPRLKSDPFPERHMGLIPFQECSDVEDSLSKIAEIGSKYLDLNAIWKIAEKAKPLKVRSWESGVRSQKSNLPLPPDNPPISPFEKGGQRGIINWGITNSAPHTQHSKLRIGVIKDSAFQFYYPENFEELEKRGAKIIEISALRDKKLPHLDALYIGGGFPETHAIALAENVKFKKSLCQAVERGLPVYAECGGLMYLGKSLIVNNKTYHMAGVLPVVFSLEKKPQAHGYTIIEVAKKDPYFPKCCILKGHEFHYSRVLDVRKNKKISMAFSMKRGQGIKNGKDGLCYKNVLATYTHLHALGADEWADGLIRCASQFSKGK